MTCRRRWEWWNCLQPSRRQGVRNNNWQRWPFGWKWRPPTCDWFEVKQVHLLRGAVRTYAWGSRTAIADFTGRPSPTPHPEAELWFGAHPGDPAWVGDGRGRAVAARRAARGSRRPAGRRRSGPLRRHPAVLGQGARGRRTLVAAG